MLSDEISATLQSLSTGPGVYRMLDADQHVLYIGKAKNLRKRVSSYFRASVSDVKTIALRTHIQSIDTILTRSEREALLLENTLIKRYKPEYNILLKDDKGYAYLHISDHTVPRISYARKRKSRRGKWFGPYTNAGAAKQTLEVLVRTFQLRTCRDAEFSNRSRPCLQHQIGRCSAPCVGLIGPEAYAQDIDSAATLLAKKSHVLLNRLTQEMELAAQAEDFERAAKLRDQMRALKEIQRPQHVAGGVGEYDVMALEKEGGQALAVVLCVRSGELADCHQYAFPSFGADLPSLMEELLARYVFEQHAMPIAQRVLLSHLPEKHTALAKSFSEALGQSLSLLTASRGERARWMEMAQENARSALQAHLDSQAQGLMATTQLQTEFGLASLPTRLECIDISHTQGAQTVASCVVFNEHGPAKAQYRRYQLDLKTGDDYEAMRQLIRRRFDRADVQLPDVLLIDGGPGQLGAVTEVLKALQKTIPLVLSISKGRTRRLGFEELHVAGWDQPPEVDPHAQGFRLLQHLRDEAHRFAIKAHRGARQKQGMRSVLDDIPGMGNKRILALIRQFEGLRGLKGAGIEDIAQTPGISLKMAKNIHEHLKKHGG